MQKHLLYIHQFFKTPQEPGGTRSYWIAKKLLEKGYKVTMITSSNDIDSKVKKTIDGIDVVYLNIFYKQNMGSGKRIIAFIKFMLKASYEALKYKNIDIVFATSTPLTVGFPAIVLKKFKKIPFVFEVRDLWPEAPIKMGSLNNKLFQKLALWLERAIYKNASHIVALSPGMQKGVLKREIKKVKTSMISNMAKVDEFYPREIDKSLYTKFGLKPNSLKLIHFGAMGKANGVQSIIKSAILLKDNDNIEFIFIGWGSEEEEMIELSKKNKLKNVHFLGSHPLQVTSELVNLSDLSIVSFLDIPILYTNSPNKLFDSLSAGKPIIVNSAGWTKDLVETNKCGFYVSPNKPEELADLLVDISKDKTIITEMGENSRKLAEQKFDKNILCEKVVKVIDNQFEK